MKNQANGRATHQDTDEAKVLGIISAVILGFTVLTVFSYADNPELAAENKLVSEETKQNTPSPFLLNTSNTQIKSSEEKTLQM